MARITKKTWTPAQEARLRVLAESGASLLRISAAVNKTAQAVRSHATALGIKIHTVRQIRAKLRDAERNSEERPAQFTRAPVPRP